MKKLLLIAIIALAPVLASAQKGISYQAVILDPNPIEIPGKDITGQPFANGSVWVKFTLLSGNVTQFQEVHQTSTDGYGLVNLTIGSVAIASFNSLVWDSNQKTLQVSVSFNQGASYTKVSDQKLLYVPYSLYAETAGKLSGILGITGGGTDASTAVGARANLGLGNVDNTADVDKPVSNAALTALNLKVDKVAGERLINAAEITKLGNQSGVNTGDQDLSSFATKSATDAALALKAPLASPSFTGTVSGISKFMVGLGNVDNTTDAAKPVSAATQSALNSKVDKVAGERLINAAEIIKLGNQSGVNTGDQDLSTFATKSATDAALALKAPLASPSLTGLPTTPTATSGTNTTQIASTEFVSTAISNSNQINAQFNQLKYVPYTGATSPVDLGSYDLMLNGLTLGQGSGQKITNTAIGRQSLWANSSGVDNTAIGANTLLFNQTGNYNTASGYQALQTNTIGNSNTAFGAAALITNTSGNKLTALGTGANVTADGLENSTAIGFGANVSSSNTIQLGNNDISEVRTSGKITAGSVTYPNADGLNGQYLTTSGNGTLEWTSPNNSASSLTGIVPISSGGTGSSLQNFVDLTNVQSIAGFKTFTNQVILPGFRLDNGTAIWDFGGNGTALNLVQGGCCSRLVIDDLGRVAIGANYSPAYQLDVEGDARFTKDIKVNSISVGKGSGTNNGVNTAIGYEALAANTDGVYNSAYGFQALTANTSGNYNHALGFQVLASNTTGNSNNAFGQGALPANTTGSDNIAIGTSALFRNTTADNNIAIGTQALGNSLTGSNNIAIGAQTIVSNTTGYNNTAIGYQSLRLNSTGYNNTALGYSADVAFDNLSNATAIGYGAIVAASNSIQLGNSNLSNVNTSGSLTANASITSDITDSFTIDPSNSESYKGKIIICDPANPITITFSSSLPTGFNCMVMQKSADANKITIAGGSGVTIKNRNNYTATAGNYAILTIVHIGNNVLVTAGDMQ